jgi:hypothetical protein
MKNSLLENAKGTAGRRDGHSSPAFVTAVEEYAREVGISSDELLKEISDLSDQPSVGGPNCLAPREVAQYCQSNSLPYLRAEHLSHCEDCRALIAGSLPDATRLEEFLAEATAIGTGEIR